MTRVILYCRVSTDEQSEGCSLEMQERFLRAYCLNHGYDVIDQPYKDEWQGAQLPAKYRSTLDQYLDKAKSLREMFLGIEKATYEREGE